MTVTDAQREVRSVFLGGSIGQIVSGIIWLFSAAVSTWVGIRQGIIVLVVGGMFIFPLTQFTLRVAGRPSTLSRENPLRHLAIQVAFIVPLTLPVVAGAALHNVNWFYPACMIIVGAHYMPFIFLYGMREYAVLAAALMGGGITLGTIMPAAFNVGGWVAGATLVVFGVIAGRLAQKEKLRAAL